MDIDKYAAEEGHEEAKRLLAGWVADGYPGPLTHENERLLEWALAAEAIGPAQADAAYSFEVAEGCEGLLLHRQMRALGWVRKAAWQAAKKSDAKDEDEEREHGR